MKNEQLLNPERDEILNIRFLGILKFYCKPSFSPLWDVFETEMMILHPARNSPKRQSSDCSNSSMNSFRYVKEKLIISKGN